MTKTSIGAAAIRDLQVLLDSGAVGGLTDGQLMERFLASRDGAAFEALVLRHGPMVWGVCRRALGDHHDAEDAFQATFLVLARRAASVVPREQVGPWLHGVASRTAMKAKAGQARRRARERTVAEMPEPYSNSHPPDGRLALLDQELERLPRKYRIPIVVCDLEGATQGEAARRLGCTVGTLSGRLRRARALLARRMTRRGLALSGGSLLAMLSDEGTRAAMPPALVGSTAVAVTKFLAGRAVVGFSPGVISLAEEVLKAMVLSKLKAITAVILAFASLSGGTALLLHSTRPAHGRAVTAEGKLKGDGVNETGKPAHRAEGHEASQAPPNAEGTLLGRWKATRFLIDGRPDPAEAVEKMELVLGDDSYRLASDPRYGMRGKGSGAGRIRVDSSKVPHEIDFLPSSGVFDGLVHRGVFEVKGETLMLCFGMPTKTRPTEFATRPNSGIYLAEFRRVAEDVGDRRNGELDSLIARVLRAHGGEARLGSLKAFSETIRETPSGGRATTTRHLIQLPDKYRCEIQYPGDDKTLVCILTPNGMRRWYRHPDRRVEEVHFFGTELPFEYWLEVLKFFGPRSVLRLKDVGYETTLLDDSMIGDRPVAGIRLRKTAPKATFDLELSIDKGTGRLLRERSRPAGTETDYEDYREFAGIPLARKTTRRADQGKQITESEVIEFKAVEKFDPALFEKP